MSDLTEYDREIVKEAEAVWQQREDAKKKGLIFFGLPNLTGLYAAVQDKRDAQRPRCDHTMEFLGPFCAKPATHALMFPDGTKRHRCDEHRVEVREL